MRNHKMTDKETIEDLITTLKAIDRRARIVYQNTPVANSDGVSTIGMMAENAILKVEPEYDGTL